ncbi:hypothetical protein EYZ11_012391 [Aspergillus tanneri]|uniref:Saposin B-type domain-containing protein n=1 Tax=Aspergillus tanneri TaxID=1220188 RepID=A0A4V3UMQ2_9EURO|nr:hypothetical protein EYZ11_012391 [Aspergillus tanneri]
MRLRILHLTLASSCLSLLGLGLFLYLRHDPPDPNPVAYCADCLDYANGINRMINRAANSVDGVRGNKQYFRYACDWNCRDELLTSGHCLKYRRAFLKHSDRYMFAVEDPPMACQGIRACP